MSLEAIVHHILAEAETQAEKLIQEARQEADKIIREAKQIAEKDYQEIIHTEERSLHGKKQGLIVNARLDCKKNILSAKQELITQVFERLKATLKAGKIKKQQILACKVEEVPEDVDFYLAQLRNDYDSEIAAILFT
jgi:vacuolar-type H+-ATPase subunit E/Vma4